jgi:mRNA-degrading endonuclease toxin of MazEF toxin-antitoxin module
MVMVVRRFEVWLVNLDLSIGKEIKKSHALSDCFSG